MAVTAQWGSWIMSPCQFAPNSTQGMVSPLGHDSPGGHGYPRWHLLKCSPGKIFHYFFGGGYSLFLFSVSSHLARQAWASVPFSVPEEASCNPFWSSSVCTDWPSPKGDLFWEGEVFEETLLADKGDTRLGFKPSVLESVLESLGSVAWSQPGLLEVNPCQEPTTDICSNHQALPPPMFHFPPQSGSKHINSCIFSSFLHAGRYYLLPRSKLLDFKVILGVSVFVPPADAVHHHAPWPESLWLWLNQH